MGQDAVTSLVFMIGIIVANVRLAASSWPSHVHERGFFFEFESLEDVGAVVAAMASS